MREIKFRAWHIKRKKYYEVHHLHIGSIGIHEKNWATCKAFDCIEQKDIYIQIQPNECILEQFTGLHDSTKWADLTEPVRDAWVRSGNMPSEWKGKEIYEGDIIEYEDIIECCDERVAITKKHTVMDLVNYIDALNWIPKSGKVIGNIHETEATNEH